LTSSRPRRELVRRRLPADASTPPQPARKRMRCHVLSAHGAALTEAEAGCGGAAAGWQVDRERGTGATAGHPN
jgi:hypothetical protein